MSDQLMQVIRIRGQMLQYVIQLSSATIVISDAIDQILPAGVSELSEPWQQ